MDLKQKVLELKESIEFKQWQKKHSEYFLAHVFVMLDEANKDILQVGFYSPEKERMTTFILGKDKINIIENQEVLKNEGEIRELDVNNVNISVEDALTLSENVKNEKYKNEIIVKKFFIVQKTDLGDIFNITFFTASFKTINIKISSIDGSVLKQSFSDLMTFG